MSLAAQFGVEQSTAQSQRERRTGQRHYLRTTRIGLQKLQALRCYMRLRGIVGLCRRSRGESAAFR
jgi:hypothetical protein